MFIIKIIQILSDIHNISEAYEFYKSDSTGFFIVLTSVNILIIGAFLFVNGFMYIRLYRRRQRDMGFSEKITLTNLDRLYDKWYPGNNMSIAWIIFGLLVIGLVFIDLLIALAIGGSVLYVWLRSVL